MANENKEIGEFVKKCKILLLDVSGTTTSISFAKNELLPYAEKNVKEFLDNHWEEDEVKQIVKALRKLAIEDKESSVEGAVDIPGEDASKEEQIEGLVQSVKWQISMDRDAGPLKELQGLIWQQAYDNGDIKGHVYDDVSPALQQWRTVDDRKVYIYSSGSVLSQKLLFGKSTAGDLLPHIDGHFDVTVGDKRDAASYTAIVEKIGCKPEDILYINDMPKEAEVARTAGINAALVSREGNAPLPTEAAESFPVIRSFTELTVTNKRKPDPEETQDVQPAKVQRKDTTEEVKLDAELTSEKVKDSATEKVQEMEVEESAAVVEKPNGEKKITQVVVEEVSEANEADGGATIDIEPVVEEIVEEKETKTEEEQTEKMEVENGTSESAEVKNGDVDVPVPEETPYTVVTEIEEISDKNLDQVAEIIEDLVPVVEEPGSAADMDELQNVGEVLEKECDEILSKVQGVTNLDNIPLKPILNPIAEDPLEVENVDSNDIVDGILDKELELEMKQCADIDLNTVTEMTEDATAEIVENKDQISPKETNDTTETKATESTIEVNNVTEKMEEENRPTEETEEAKVEETQKTEIDSKETPKEVSVVAGTNSTEGSNENKTVEKIEPVADEVKSVAEEAKPEVVDTTELKEQAKSNLAEEKSASVDSSVENDKEPQVNGKTNGDAGTVNLNGNASKDEELNSRLTVENGKEMNGSVDGEQGQGDNKVEPEVTDIKVKTVTTDEPHTDPIEPPTEA